MTVVKIRRICSGRSAVLRWTFIVTFYKNRIILSKWGRLTEQIRKKGKLNRKAEKQGARIQKRRSWIENPVFIIVKEK